MEVRTSIQALESYVRKHRRALHKIPEICLDTRKTKAYLFEELGKLGVDVIDESFIETGLVAIVYGADQEQMIGFRCDMDALAISEQSGVAFASQHENCMHACGHDGHMAIVLGLIKYVKEHKDDLMCSIAFVFQPGEENPGGARIMIENGLFEDYPIKAMVGTHLMNDVPKGKVSCKAGPLMARVSELYFDVIGTGAHGAMPYLGNDALLAASTFVVQLQNIISRAIDPTHNAVLTIGTLQAGEVRNAVASSAHLEGTMRSFDDQDHEWIRQKIIEIGKGIELSFGVEVKVNIVDCYPIVNNDKKLYETLKEAINEDLLLERPRMIAEDFSFYQQQVPGLFYFTGIQDEQHGYSLHDPRFDFDESALCISIETNVRLLETMHILKKRL